MHGFVMCKLSEQLTKYLKLNWLFINKWQISSIVSNKLRLHQPELNLLLELTKFNMKSLKVSRSDGLPKYLKNEAKSYSVYDILLL